MIKFTQVKFHLVKIPCPKHATSRPILLYMVVGILKSMWVFYYKNTINWPHLAIRKPVFNSFSVITAPDLGKMII